MILRGESFLPVRLAGHSLVHLPHSVHEYAAIKLFQLKSLMSFAPKRPGSAGAVGAGAKPNIDFTSFVTTGMLLICPLTSSLA